MKLIRSGFIANRSDQLGGDKQNDFAVRFRMTDRKKQCVAIVKHGGFGGAEVVDL